MALDHREAKAAGGFFWLWILLTFIWFAANSSSALESIATGGVLAIELVRANINMLRYVYARRIVINPGVVEIKTRLKTPVGRLALANSIALTPGSLVIDIRGDSLFIHWLDVKTTDPDAASRLIAGPFEQHLEKTFG
jgi:multicomponent Na+:H+ antiporter subunit E